MLDHIDEALRDWQRDDVSFQLHPGDVGWFQRFGVDALTGALRTWEVDGRLAAVGLLDGSDLLRVALAPDHHQDRPLAERIVADLPEGVEYVETPPGAVLHAVLGETGWPEDDPWALLRRDLTDPVPDCGLRVETVGPDLVPVFTAVQRAAFEGSTFTDEKWQAMAASPAYSHARSLVAFDGDEAVASAIVWSAGTGRPGVLEPLGVHRDHRGAGHGRAMALACAATLRELGATSALVATPVDNTGAVATYAGAGFARLPDRVDRRRS